MKTNFLIFLTFVLFSKLTYLYGQPNENQMNEKLLTFSSGMSILYKQDNIYSPIVHKGNSISSYCIQFHKKRQLQQYFHLNFSSNKSQKNEAWENMEIGHGHGYFPHEFINISLGYGVGRHLATNETNNQTLGIQFRSDIQVAFYNFHLSNMFGYFINQSFGPWYKFETHIRHKHFFSLQTELPLMSWTARPGYLAEDDEFIDNISSHNNGKIFLEFVKDGKLTTLNTLQKINLDLNYRYQITKRISIGLKYLCEYTRVSQPKILTALHQQAHISTSIKL